LFLALLVLVSIPVLIFLGVTLRGPVELVLSAFAIAPGPHQPISELPSERQTTESQQEMMNRKFNLYETFVIRLGVLIITTLSIGMIIWHKIKWR
jgi:hypothetical protein